MHNYDDDDDAHKTSIVATMRCGRFTAIHVGAAAVYFYQHHRALPIIISTAPLQTPLVERLIKARAVFFLLYVLFL